MATRTKEQRDSRPASRGAARMVNTSNDLPQDVREKMIALLNRELAGLFDLFSQTKQAHWNVKGPQFYQLHELYDELAETVLGHVDTVAERATALGGAATGTARMAAAGSKLEEFSDGPIAGRDSVRMLADRYAALGKMTREFIDQADKAGDMDTNDLFVEVSRDLDKSLWFLEAHLQEG